MTTHSLLAWQQFVNISQLHAISKFIRLEIKYHGIEKISFMVKLNILK